MFALPPLRRRPRDAIRGTGATLRPSPSRIVNSRIRPPNTAAVMKALRMFVVIRTTITIASATNCSTRADRAEAEEARRRRLAPVPVGADAPTACPLRLSSAPPPVAWFPMSRAAQRRLSCFFRRADRDAGRHTDRPTSGARRARSSSTTGSSSTGRSATAAAPPPADAAAAPCRHQQHPRTPRRQVGQLHQHTAVKTSSGSTPGPANPGGW